MRAWRAALALGAGLFAPAFGGVSAAAQADGITVVPAQRLIPVTPRYRGDLVRVSGTAPASAEIVLKLTSTREEVVCSQKGKIGPFWLSVRQVRIQSVPGMFKIESTAPLADILPDSEQVEYRLGRVGLKASMAVAGGLDRDLYLDELIHIRERDRRFSFSEGGVRRDGDTYETSFFWPPDGPTGRYRLEAYAVERGRVVARAETWVDVRAVGVEAWTRDLARNHGVLYGLFAVALAAVAGLAVSLLMGGWHSSERSPAPPDAVMGANGKVT